MIFERVKKLGKVALSFVLTIAIITISLCISFGVSAASFAGGSGTMQDPYLVATAEQLLGMRENLSAHYKLANTIDLKGVKFSPIGNLEKPFTGSFSCDTGSNGRPLYAIKNLNFVLEETIYLGEKINRWEAGLFGAINGARIANIYVLDAYVENKNEGFARGAIKYNNYKPSQDEMGCAVLVCDAVDSEITHCYTSGKVTGKSNWMAGLVGRAYGGKVSYCGSSVDVINQRGFFGSGGLIGDCSTEVSFCFATGTVEGGGQNATTGGLIGQSCRAFYGVTDSYCTGKVSNKSYEAFSFAGFSGGNGQEHEEVELSNCYTLSTVTDANAAVYKVDGFTVHNSYISKDVAKGYQKDFDLADKAKIASSIGKRSGWEIGADGYPVIAGNTPLTKEEAAAYVPGASVGGSTTPTPDSNTSNTQSGGTANNGATNSVNTNSGAANSSTASSKPGSASSQSGATSKPASSNGSTTQSSTTSSSATNSVSSSVGNTTNNVQNNNGGVVQNGVSNNIQSGVNNNAGNTATDNGGAQTTVTLDDFTNAINALPSETEFTHANLPQLVNAQRIYNQLTEEQLTNIDSAARIKFITIKNSVQETILVSLKAEVEKLPKVKKIKAKDKEKVLELADMYSLLSDDAKVALDQDLREKLEAAIKKVNSFEEKEETSASASNLTTVEIILLVMLVFLNVLAIAFCVFNCIKSYKLIKIANSSFEDIDDAEEDSAE